MIGKWIISSDGYYPYCSLCYNEPESGELELICPHCGADMTGSVKQHANKIVDFIKKI